MADHPEAEQSTTADRTSALVAGGLVVLAILGVVTVFSDTIAAAWSPTANASTASATSTSSSIPVAAAAPEPASPSLPAPAGAGGSS